MKKRAVKPEAAPEPEKPEKPKKGKKRGEDAFALWAAAVEKADPTHVALASSLDQEDVPRISTGNFGLDVALYGGWPQGRVCIAVGKEKSAKTGSCLNTVVQWQQNHCASCYRAGTCADGCDYKKSKTKPKAGALWIDVENRLRRMLPWIKAHGVDLDRLVIKHPGSGQAVIDFVHNTIREYGTTVGLIVVDSMANVVSKEEIDKPTVKGKTAPVNAMLINKGLRLWTAAANDLGIREDRLPTVLLINQLRQTLDQYHPEVQTGGIGLRYATSVDVRFQSGKYFYVVQDKDGNWVERSKSFQSGWEPDEDQSPDFVEINYRVQNSGVCPQGRYGQFRYWLKALHGRRVGDPDNPKRVFGYAKKYEMIGRSGRDYKLENCTAPTLDELESNFSADAVSQKIVWDKLMDLLVYNPPVQPDPVTAQDPDQPVAPSDPSELPSIEAAPMESAP